MTDACNSTSSVDCGKCKVYKRTRIEGRNRCISTCTGTDMLCKRLSLDVDELDMCLQHCLVNVNNLVPKQHNALLSFISKGSMTDERKREYEMMIRGRLLPLDLQEYVHSFAVDFSEILRSAMARSSSPADSRESIDLVRTTYKLDTYWKIRYRWVTLRDLDSILHYRIISGVRTSKRQLS